MIRVFKYGSLRFSAFSTLLLGIFPLSAQGVNTEVSTGVYYFSDVAAKRLAAETEVSEGGLRFHSNRDPREVARDNADEEIRQGNVCLTQAKRDLKAALKSFRVRSICNEIYKDELGDALRRAAKEKVRADVFRCYADAEAHEAEGFIRIKLSFRGQLVTHEPIPAKFHKAGFPEEPMGWALAAHESVGAPEWGWKGALREGSCSFNEPALDKFLISIREKRQEEKALALCREKELHQLDSLQRLQSRLKEYVPEDWLADAGGAELPALLIPPVGGDSYTGLTECQARREQTGDQLEKLQKVSAKIADRHEVPALSPESSKANRSPASDVED